MEQRINMSGSLVAVSVGRPAAVDRSGRPAETAIWKNQVTGPVAATGVNLAGDDQADRSAHGGYDKAVYAYADEDRQWWEQELDRSIDLAGFGETSQRKASMSRTPSLANGGTSGRSCSR